MKCAYLSSELGHEESHDDYIKNAENGSVTNEL
jgi:hypothetical protein